MVFPAGGKAHLRQHVQCPFCAMPAAYRRANLMHQLCISDTLLCLPTFPTVDCQNLRRLSLTLICMIHRRHFGDGWMRKEQNIGKKLLQQMHIASLVTLSVRHRTVSNIQSLRNTLITCCEDGTLWRWDRDNPVAA